MKSEVKPDGEVAFNRAGENNTKTNTTSGGITIHKYWVLSYGDIYNI